MHARIAPLIFVFVWALSSRLPAAEPNTLTAEEIADGWILLFDGQTDYGWQAGSKANWKVADGTISVDAGEMGLLHTTSQFADYVLKVDFRSAQTRTAASSCALQPCRQTPRSIATN